MTKIEEVARALCRVWLFKAGRDILRDGIPIDPVAMAGATYSGVDKHWRQFIEAAEAAIQAMRKPTQAMIDEWSHHRNPEHVGYDSDCDECATADWQSMIDAALAEKPE